MGIAVQGLGGVFGLIFVIGWIWLLITIFQSGDVLWGVLGILCGLLALIWGFTHFEQAKKPFIVCLIGLIGGAIFGGGGVMIGGG